MKIRLPNFTHARILVIGDVMLDRYVTGATRRISPEAPVPVVNVKETEDRPGGAANVARSIAALGGTVKLIGVTGDDEAGTILSTQLQQNAVDADFVRSKALATIIKLRVLSHGQQLIRLDFEQHYEADDTSSLLEKYSKVLPQVTMVVLSDYAKGTLSEAQNMIAMAKAAGVKVLVDPKGSDFRKYQGADLITPNLSEFEAIAGPCASDEDLAQKATALLQELNLGAMLVTRSDKGMTLFSEEQQVLHLPTTAVSVSDVTGAGDTVISTLATALASGSEPEEACKLANIAAGLVVTKVGTSTVTRAELAGALAIHSDTGLGIFSKDQLIAIVEDAKCRGERIVITNGCFDIIHAGHISYLDSAAQLGDRLIVAVNSDESVRHLKGPTRPVNSCANRMKVLAGIGAVDWVVEFSEETPEMLITTLLPDVLVKGGDYKVEEIAGHKQVLANGGEVKVLQFEEGYSTSGIIQAIKKS